MPDLLDDPGASLPDGTQPVRWDQVPEPTRTYYVDQRSPHASDGGEGSAERPFLTINRAAQVVRAGEAVVVHPGIYREHVRPARSGDSPEGMVTFEAAPGGEVVIRGSVELASEWVRSTGTGPADETWMIRLPASDFRDHNPFALENVDRSDPISYQSSIPQQRSPSDTLRRGLLFQGGRRLTQVGTLADLSGEPGRYWVEPDGLVVHVRPFDGANPNDVVMEATNLAQCFAPVETGVSFVRVKGFVVEQVGNGFSYPVQGAISPMGGHHWIIEDNIVRHISADGIGIGNHAWVWGGTPGSELGTDCIVRRNLVEDCGVSGVKGCSVERSIVEDNVFDGIGWQGVADWYDNGGLKLLVCRDLIVRHNLFRNMLDAPGIWLDWDLVNCRVTQNVLVHGRYPGGSIFLEATVEPNWVDHNVVWDIEGPGVYCQDADEVQVFENVIGKCSPAALVQLVTDRPIRDRTVSIKRNHIHSNVFVDCEVLVTFGDPENSSDHNVIIDGLRPTALADWQASNPTDANSIQIQAEMELDTKTFDLAFRSNGPVDCELIPRPFRAVVGHDALTVFTTPT